jgi:hypothetical protein
MNCRTQSLRGSTHAPERHPSKLPDIKGLFVYVNVTRLFICPGTRATRVLYMRAALHRGRVICIPFKWYGYT